MVSAPFSGAWPPIWAAAVSLSSAATQHSDGRPSRGFVDRVLLPEFTELEGALQVYLHEVTLRVIREEIYDDASDAQEFPTPCRRTDQTASFASEPSRSAFQFHGSSVFR